MLGFVNVPPVTDTLPPVSDTLFDDSVEKVPAADVAPPITTPSIVPPSKSTTDDVELHRQYHHL